MNFRRMIFYIFAALLFLVPLVLWPTTSEVFEFNKIVLTYALTTVIFAAWTARMISEKKFIFRKTVLDTPLLLFLASQLISTIISIDPGTSWLGYYSRFNGGFVSTLCYVILYWAFVTNIEKEESMTLIKTTFVSALFVCIYAVLEHFGIDKDVWVQDVKSRVFSTLGQPNWLASWVVALIPLTWAFTLTENPKKLNFWIYAGLSVLFFWTLIFTKSRSGFLGLGVSSLVFLVLVIREKGKEIGKFVPVGIGIVLSFILICAISGTQWTPSIAQVISSKNTQPVPTAAGPALETGGTESGTIRKIVWKGAIEVWKHYPVFGTGVETFAYSYYRFRPAEHNLVSEWDFVYNKAHNQYLNFAANSGTLGLMTYLLFIAVAIYSMRTKNLLNSSLIAGISGLIFANFFGFSVVPTDIQLFLFPAFAFVLANSEAKSKNTLSPSSSGKAAILAVFIVAFFVISGIVKYWIADVRYAKARELNGQRKSVEAANILNEAISLNAGQALYHSELSTAYTSIARAYAQEKDASGSAKYAGFAVGASEKAITLSPASINIKRMRFGMFVMLTTINPGYIIQAGQTLSDTIAVAPTDAKLYYNLALYYLQINQPVKAEEVFKKTIELKANYKEARLAYAVFLIDAKRNPEAKVQLEYILTKIDPKDEIAKSTLESIK